MLRNRKGFTLVEVIVVVVILAILAAILIPSVTGYIDKGKEKAAVADCMNCVSAAKAVLSKVYGSGVEMVAEETAAWPRLPEVMDTATVTGEITRVDYDASPQLKHLIYVSDETRRVVYCYKGGCGKCGNEEMYTINGLYGVGLATEGGWSDPGDTFLGALATIPSWNRIDSTAPGGVNTNQQKLLAALDDLNMVLSDANIRSWAVRKESGSAPIVWFSDQDISGMREDTMVRVIRYNKNRDTYTAGYMRIENHSEGGQTYSAFVGGLDAWVEYGLGTADEQTKETKASYDKTMDIFNSIPPILE